MSTILVLTALLLGTVSCPKFNCVNEDCTELMSTAKAKTYRPIKHNHELNVKKGDEVEIYGKLQDKYLVKKPGYDKFCTLPSNILVVKSKEKKTHYKVLIEFDVKKEVLGNRQNNVTCSKKERLMEIFFARESQDHGNNTTTTASNESDVSNINESVKDVRATVNSQNVSSVTGSMAKEDSTLLARGKDTTESSQRLEVETEVVQDDHIINEKNGIDSNVSFAKNYGRVPFGGITEDEKRVGDEVLNVDIQKSKLTKFNSEERRDNLMNSNHSQDVSANNETAKFAANGKLNKIRPVGEVSSNVTSYDIRTSNQTDEIFPVVPDNSRNVKVSDTREDSNSSNQINTTKIFDTATQIDASSELPVALTRNGDTAESAEFRENTNDTLIPSTEEVVNSRSTLENIISQYRVGSKVPVPVNHIDNISTVSARFQLQPQSVNSFVENTASDNSSSTVEGQTSSQTMDAAARSTIEKTDSISEHLNEKVSIAKKKRVHSNSLQPNNEQLEQKGDLKVSPPPQGSTNVNEPDTIPQGATDHQEAITNINGKEETNFYGIIRKQKPNSLSPESIKVIKDVGYLDTFVEYASNLSSIMESFVLSFLDFSRGFFGTNSPSQNDYCVTDCEPSRNDITLPFGYFKFDSGSFWDSSSKSSRVAVVGISLYFVLCLVILVSMHSNFKTKRKLRNFVSVINKLESRLLVAKKELLLLKSDGTDSLDSDSATVMKKRNEVLTLEQQLSQFQRRNTELEDKVLYLERELENVSTSALEIHKLLENSLITQTSSKTAEDDVETLRTLTEKQEADIDELVKQMDSIVTENQCLKDDLKKIEKECTAQTKKNLELAEKHRELTVRLERQIENNASLKNNYKSEIYRLQSKLEDTEMSLRRYEFQLEEMNRAFSDKHEARSGSELRCLDGEAQLKLQISTLTAINNELTVELKEQKNARRMLDEHVGDVIKELKDLKKLYEAVEKERNEATTKLHVLTNYFNDKEAQLHKELEEKEKLFVENESKDQLLSQKLASLHEEIRNYKARNEELKKEIQDQEGSYKIQLAAAEQKARDLWFALRQTERKYQESEKEAATLRNKLLISETNLSSANQKLNEKTNNVNGDISPIPILYRPTMSPDLLPYRSPTEIIPPPPSPIASHSPDFFPPEPSYSPDERLPPLGGRRVPSPPLLMGGDQDDFKPPPPHAQYMAGRSRNEPPMPPTSSFLRTPSQPQPPPPPPPPSVPNRLRNAYTTRQQRNSADSPSSGVSMESLDKSGR